MDTKNINVVTIALTSVVAIATTVFGMVKVANK